MNPPDLPDVVAEPVIKMHAVISAPKALSGGVGRLERSVGEDVKSLGEEMLENSWATVRVITRGFELFLYCLLAYDAQLRSHLGRLYTLKHPSA
jgi:hypothetical protein